MRSTPLETVVDSIRKNGICLKGILASPDVLAEGDTKTLNMKLRCVCNLIFFRDTVKSPRGT